MEKINISKYVLSLLTIVTLSTSSATFAIDIFQAIRENNIDAVKEILKDKNFEINEIGQDGLETGKTPLYCACSHDCLEIARLLLEHDANPNIVDQNGQTPLYCACFDRNLRIVRLLLEYKADPNIAEKANNETPLHRACKNNNPNIASLLLKSGANPNKIERFFGETPLCCACCFYNKPEIVRLLLEYSANPNIANNKDITPLHNACKLNSNNPEIVKLLLEHGADYTAISEWLHEGETPYAIAANKPEILHWLDLTRNYKLTENKTQFILDTQRTNEERSFLIKLSLCNSIKENDKKQMQETTFGKLYFDQNFGPEKLADILQINLHRNEKGNIFKLIRAAAEEHHLFLPKYFIEKREMVKELLRDEKRVNKRIVCCDGNEIDLFGCLFDDAF